MTVNPLDRLDPNLALRPGTWDARAILGLWIVRKSFLPLFWLGMSVAFIALGDADALASELETFDSPAAMASAILSPLGLLVAAFVIRIVGNLVALAAAVPLTLGSVHIEYSKGNRITSFFHLWWDRLYQARAYRSLRWTWAVRRTAHNRLGDEDRIYRILEFVMIWANIALFIAMLITITIFGAESVA